MSSISNLPYGKILDYWYENLKGHKHRNKFLLTKFIEAFTFNSNSKKLKAKYKFTPFPIGGKNQLPIKPKMALVIPVYAKSSKDIQDLSNLFSSIAKLEYQPEFVIVVDDNSPKSYDIPNQFIKVKNELNCGPAKARNRGIDLALKNEIDVIAFTDSDCILESNWTKQIVFYFQQHQTCGIISGNTISNDKHWFGTYHNINGTLNGRKFKNSNRLLYGTTANLAITAEIGKKIRFNEKFPNAAGEDIEFCFRANNEGFELNHNPEMIVYHNYGYTDRVLDNLNIFINQFRKYGKGEKILLEQIPEYYAYFNETEEIKAE
ncbi:MAG: glycosyltransferase [Bacteroidetes bacterium]|nr:glycosyltransferase [Bacteroidota bacterium]